MNDAVSSESALPVYCPPPDVVEVRYHATVFMLATSVLVGAALLSVRGNHVMLPFANLPLPGLCTFRTVTGIDCPGCGSTRSFICLVRADMRGAWSFNPAGLLVFAVVAFQVPYRSWQIWLLAKGSETRPWRNGAHFLWIVVLALFAQWLVRIFVGGIS